MAEDKMWYCIGWYGFIGVITSSTDKSLHFGSLCSFLNWENPCFCLQINGFDNDNFCVDYHIMPQL